MHRLSVTFARARPGRRLDWCAGIAIDGAGSLPRTQKPLNLRNYRKSIATPRGSGPGFGKPPGPLSETPETPETSAPLTALLARAASTPRRGTRLVVAVAV